MLKKTLLTALLALAATGVASANGFYAGAGVGGSALHSSNDLTRSSTTTNTDVGNLGLLGGVFAGYSFNLDNQLNLGLEAFANADSVKAQYQIDSYDYTGKLTYNYGLRLVPGYQITADTDLHLLAGIARGHFTVRDSDGGEDGSANVYGWQGGFGSTTAVNSNFSVRGDIIYTGYKKQTYSLGSGASLSFKASTLDGVISGEFKFG